MKSALTGLVYKMIRQNRKKSEQYHDLNLVSREYTNKAALLTDKSWYLLATQTTQDSTTDNFLKYFDSVIHKMGRDEKNKIATKFSKIIPSKAKSWRNGYDGQFRDILTEIIGYDFLVKRGFVVSIEKTPDLIGHKRNQIIAMECKNFTAEYHVPNNQKISFTAAFKNKMDKKLEYASQQVNKVKTTKRIIFVNVNTDSKFMLQFDKTQKKLLKYLNYKKAEYQQKGIEVIFFKEYNYKNTI